MSDDVTIGQPTRYLLDDDGDLWQQRGDDLWSCPRANGFGHLSLAEIEADYSPVVELVPATRIAELEQQLNNSEQARALLADKLAETERHALQQATHAMDAKFVAGQLDEALTLLRQLAAPPQPLVLMPPTAADIAFGRKLTDTLRATQGVPVPSPRAEAPEAGSGELRAESEATEDERPTANELADALTACIGAIATHASGGRDTEMDRELARAKHLVGQVAALADSSRETTA